MTFKLLFNYWIIANYLGALIFYLIQRNIPDSLYWFFALGITLTVTFAYQRSSI